MATIHHQIQHWTWDIPPGGSLWLSYGPDDRYKNGTVQVTACPSTQVAGTTIQQTQTLSVPEVFISQVPTLMGDIVLTSAYAGFNVTNRGDYTIRYFSLALTVIQP